MEGTGLGLFIVKELLTKIDSTIHIANNSPSGSVISVEVKCLEERSKVDLRLEPQRGKTILRSTTYNMDIRILLAEDEKNLRIPLPSI